MLELLTEQFVVGLERSHSIFRLGGASSLLPRMPWGNAIGQRLTGPPPQPELTDFAKKK